MDVEIDAFVAGVETVRGDLVDARADRSRVTTVTGAAAARPAIIAAMASSWAAIIVRHASRLSSAGNSNLSAGGFPITARASGLTVDGTGMSRAGSRTVPCGWLTSPPNQDVSGSGGGKWPCQMRREASSG